MKTKKSTYTACIGLIILNICPTSMSGIVQKSNILPLFQFKRKTFSYKYEFYQEQNTF